jgi:energy-coupling factor transport system substrate-specific component
MSNIEAEIQKTGNRKKDSHSRWAFDKQSLIFLTIGTVVFLLLDILFSIFYIGNVYYYITVRIYPAIVIPMIFGLLYGPIIGFFSGFLGKFIADLILYQFIWIWWPLGFGLIGLLVGMTYKSYEIGKYEDGKKLFKATLISVGAGVIGILIPSLISIFFDQLSIYFSIFYSIPMFSIVLLNGFTIMPISTRIIEYYNVKKLRLNE